MGAGDRRIGGTGMTWPRPTRPLHFGEFVALMALMMSSVAFSIDAMLPALPTIGLELSPDAPQKGQLVITSFVLGMGLGVMICGPVSDAYGRKSVLLIGIAAYIAGSLLAMQAQSIDGLLAARFLQGLGGCRAARDRHRHGARHV